MAASTINRCCTLYEFLGRLNEVTGGTSATDHVRIAAMRGGAVRVAIVRDRQVLRSGGGDVPG